MELVLTKNGTEGDFAEVIICKNDSKVCIIKLTVNSTTVNYINVTILEVDFKAVEDYDRGIRISRKGNFIGHQQSDRVFENEYLFTRPEIST